MAYDNHNLLINYRKQKVMFTVLMLCWNPRQKHLEEDYRVNFDEVIRIFV